MSFTAGSPLAAASLTAFYKEVPKGNTRISHFWTCRRHCAILRFYRVSATRSDPYNLHVHFRKMRTGPPESCKLLARRTPS